MWYSSTRDILKILIRALPLNVDTDLINIIYLLFTILPWKVDIYIWWRALDSVQINGCHMQVLDESQKLVLFSF